ncbi:unnamed protein product [Cladocopium goreaui]|uniref:Renin (Angiotensinogenase) n=1 Tax=Cladocopium goreaui TaxID=2562237 RepID=A0A9P1BUJ8_9DINO|nr:unnamed protein product [Cladocopium goreaui]
MTAAFLFLTAAALTVAGARAASTVTVPLQRRQRWMEADRWGRRQSTTEYFGHLSLPDDEAGAWRTWRTVGVSFDTGSGNVVLPCAPREGPRLRYDACSVSGSESPEPPLTLTFGTGEVNGSYADAPICVASLCAKLRWVAGWQLSEEPFGQAPFEGVLGLALPALAEGGNFSFFDELANWQQGSDGGWGAKVVVVFTQKAKLELATEYAGLSYWRNVIGPACLAMYFGESKEVNTEVSRRLEQNVFAIYFPQDPWEDAELLLGGIDERRMETKLTWVPVSRPGFWQVAVRDLTLDGEDMNLCGSQGEESDLLLDLDASDALQLMAVDVPAPHGPVMLLGDLFLRKYYTVYDRQRLQIGFALARHGAKKYCEAVQGQKVGYLLPMLGDECGV